ncbi:MAG: hypothetical protein WC029_11035 [Sulfuricella sp.]|jgi:hypothetical protein
MNLIHIGLPKAASTTLQSNIFRTQERFANFGKVNNTYQNEVARGLIGRILFQDSVVYDSKSVENMVGQLRAGLAAQGDGRPLLFSDEALSVEGYVDRRIIATRLYDLFSPAKILIVLRSQTSMLKSFYLHAVKSGGERRSFATWLKANYAGISFPTKWRIGLDYNALVGVYEEIFGPQNTVIVLLEEMHDYRTDFFNQLQNILGIPAQDIHLCLSRARDNERMSYRHGLFLKLQSLLPAGNNLALTGRGMMPLAIYDLMHQWVVSGRRINFPEMPPEWEAEIYRRCAHQNAILAERRGLPLEDLGYPYER